MIRPGHLGFAVLLLAGCSIHDSHLANEAQTRLIGMSEVDLESCLGAPDQHSTIGNTDILTYYASSTSNSSFTIPIIGGIGLSNGGYCHATYQVRDSHVTQILYSGEKNALFAPNAYCAPILRTCLEHLAQQPPPSPEATPGDRTTPAP